MMTLMDFCTQVCSLSCVAHEQCLWCFGHIHSFVK